MTQQQRYMFAMFHVDFQPHHIWDQTRPPVSPRLASTFYLFKNTRYIRCHHFVRPRRMARKYKKSGWGWGGIDRASGQGLVFPSSPGETTTAHSYTERTAVTGVHGVLGEREKGGISHATTKCCLHTGSPVWEGSNLSGNRSWRRPR